MARNRAQKRDPASRGSRRDAEKTRLARAGRARRTARLAPRRKPTQTRSRETVSAVLAAAAELFATAGPARTTTNRIAARAGVSVGSLYQYFPNKEAILAALGERHAAQVEAALGPSLARLADPAIPLRRSLHDLLVGLCAVHDAEPLLARAVSAPAPG